MSTAKPIHCVAIIGTGVIGASWTALFLANGLEVVATDVALDAEAALIPDVGGSRSSPGRWRRCDAGEFTRQTFATF
jgi:3-hydroxyacyl-CoA dehydrogenase